MLLSDQEFHEFARIVFEHSGIHIREDKRTLLQARLTKLCRHQKIPDYKTLLKRLQCARDASDAITQLIDAVSTNVTRFFRETQHFDLLTSQWIPSMIERHEQSRGLEPIRIWSAACSTGQEPYSLILHLKSQLPASAFKGLQFLATDISTRVLSVAQNGIYETRHLENVDPELLSRYFQPLKDGRFQIDREFRQQIKFRHFNLMQPFPFKHCWDLIFCRNVMIYFENATQQDLASRFHQVLKPGGWLVVGLSETVNRAASPFRFLKASTYVRVN